MSKLFKPPLHNQAHWQVALADPQPKPTKELNCPSHEGLMSIKHETLTRGINKLKISGLRRFALLIMFTVN